MVKSDGEQIHREVCLANEEEREKKKKQFYYMTTQKSNHVYYLSHDLFNSYMTCLNDLMSHVIKIHMDSLINHHVIVWRRKTLSMVILAN